MPICVEEKLISVARDDDDDDIHRHVTDSLIREKVLIEKNESGRRGGGRKIDPAMKIRI